MNYCQCGCGQQLVQKYKYRYVPKFVWGHNTRIKNPVQDEKVRRKITKSVIKYYEEHPEAKETLSISMKKARETGAYGKKHKEKLSISGKKAWAEGKFDGKRKNLGKSLKETWKDPKKRKEQSKILIDSWKELEASRKKLSKATTDAWRDPIKRENLIKGQNRKPTKPELHFDSLLQQWFPKEWKYVGDFKFWIEGKNPDWVNINSKKAVIELYGDYFHKGENPKKRINFFKKYGFKTLVVWEKELKNTEKLRQKVTAWQTQL